MRIRGLNGANQLSKVENPVKVDALFRGKKPENEAQAARNSMQP